MSAVELTDERIAELWSESIVKARLDKVADVTVFARAVIAADRASAAQADGETQAILRWIMREAEALKEPCGEDPEDPIAIKNGRAASIAMAAAQALGMVRGPSYASAAQADTDWEQRWPNAVTPASAAQAEPVVTQSHDTLSHRVQSRCLEWGVYWRAPDAHGVDLSIDQAADLLRDALGVEVNIAAPSVAERDAWEPIETAPVSGRGEPTKWFLAFNGHHIGVCARWGDEGYGEYIADETDEIVNPTPTHWLPMPKPPIDAAIARGERS